MVIPVIVFRESIQPEQLIARLQLGAHNESLAWCSSEIAAVSFFLLPWSLVNMLLKVLIV